MRRRNKYKKRSRFARRRYKPEQARRPRTGTRKDDNRHVGRTGETRENAASRIISKERKATESTEGKQTNPEKCEKTNTG